MWQWYNLTMKRILFIFFLILIISSVSFAETGDMELTINSQPVVLEHPIILTPSGGFFAPMEEFFGAMRIPLDELPSRHLAVFRDNIFVKFRPDYPLYELNGREFRWQTMPTTRDDVLYIEIDVFLKYMDLAYSYDEENHQLDVRSSQNLDFYRPDSTALKQVPSLRTGLRYSVPNFWNRLDSGYGTVLLDQEIIFNLDRLTSTEPNLEDAVIEHLADPTLDLLGLDFMPVRSLQTPLFKASIHHYHRISQDPDETTETRISLWGFFELDNQFYSANLESNLADQAYLEQVFEDILESIESNTYSIDSLSEHYVEFNNYSLHRAFISSPVYSNIMTAGQLTFRGNIQPDIEYLDVLVKKGRRTFEYQIPVTYGSFDEPIPIPFGLGFHQVTVLLPDTIEPADDVYLEEDPRTLIKFSVINRTLGESLLLSSSKLVNKNHELVQAAVSDIPVRSTNYEKAEQAFAKLDQFSFSTNQTLDQLLSDNTGNSQAIASVYTSYLRAMDIPSRILKTRYGQDYYVEFFSNGKWIFTRPGNFIRDRQPMSRYFGVSKPSAIQLDLLDY